MEPGSAFIWRGLISHNFLVERKVWLSESWHLGTPSCPRKWHKNLHCHLSPLPPCCCTLTVALHQIPQSITSWWWEATAKVARGRGRKGMGTARGVMGGLPGHSLHASNEIKMNLALPALSGCPSCKWVGSEWKFRYTELAGWVGELMSWKGWCTSSDPPSPPSLSLLC